MKGLNLFFQLTRQKRTKQEPKLEAGNSGMALIRDRVHECMPINTKI